MSGTETGDPGISVVIPCLNEEKSIGRVVDAAFEGITEAKLTGEVLVVDNGSTDRSADIALGHGARIIKELERGYGAALRKGLAHAHYEVIVMGDGDLTYDFTKLNQMIQPIIDGEADFVIGNRMRNIRPGVMPTLHKYLGNPVLSLMLRFMFRNHSVKDAHCGMRAIRRSEYQKLGCVTTGMEFASEMIVRAFYRKLRVREVDIIYHSRVGKSKLVSYRDGWRHLRFMLLHSPTWALLVPGFLTWLVSMAIMVMSTFRGLEILGHTLNIHSIIMAGLLNVISMQYISMGIVAKSYAHFSGLREDVFVIWLYNRFTFERAIIYTLPLVLIGIFIIMKVVSVWIVSGFSTLNQASVLLLGILFLSNGTQLWAMGYVLSILALPRHIGPMNHQDSSGREK